MTPSVAVALDKTKLSNRKIIYVLAATAQSLGHSIDELKINPSSIHREREEYWKETAKKLKEIYKETSSFMLVVHWDGKLLPDLTAKDLADCLPVLLSVVGVSQLLGVLKLHSGGTGEAQASTVAKLLEE